MPDNGSSLLQQLGFTAYEAKAWLTLAHATMLTGYEVAKRSGIPRANIYPVLDRLVERGAARRIDARDGVRYAATPTAQLLDDMQREQQHLLSAAKAALPSRPDPSQEQPVYSLQSAEQAMLTARRLIGEARQALFIALQPQEAAPLAPELRDAHERGVKITTLCMEACPAECGACRGTIHRCAMSPDGAGRWLLISADEAFAIAVEFNAGGVRAIETRQPLVVQLVTSYIRQSAALAVLGGELGDQFDGLVSLQARALLEGLQPHGGFPHRAAQASTEENTASRPDTGITQEEDSP
ncbi:MAG TPA: helix-turn-helix domain-containing protein [Rhodanobacteraceae bacterium]|nr:helix-turn-helix domain-containing protein [Rhodanobacteraceae bacterium]